MSGTLSSSESMMVRAGEPPVDAICRAAIGFLALPVLELVVGEPPSNWMFVAWFVAVLAALRVVPAVVRKVVRFPAAVRTAWAERRHLGVRYDSYQWQKLFWTGLGLAIYLATAGRLWTSFGLLAGACVVAGGFGLAVWTMRRKQIAAAKALAGK